MIGLDIPKGLIGLDLFTGIGGISYALKGFVTPVCYCEIDPYCQSVLLQRMQAGDLPKAPIWDDVCTLPFQELPPIDIIYGGFPCTDISIAGRGEGLAGKQSGLFFEIMRLAKEIRPKWIFLENVPALTHRGGIQVLEELAKASYDVRWCVISASSVGALHRRERIFILAHSESKGSQGFGGIAGRPETEQPEFALRGKDTIPHSDNKRNDSTIGDKKESTNSLSNGCNDCSNTYRISSREADTSTEPIDYERQAWGDDTGFPGAFESRDDWEKALGQVGVCIDELSAKLDFNRQQLKALGNSVVPMQVRKAFKILMGLAV